MKFNFKKITSMLASAIMLGSTVGIAAAAGTYPAPFIKGGVADVAVVVGASAASSDYLAAVNLGQSLQTELAKQTATTSTVAGTISGEAAELFSGSSKIFINDSLSVVKNVVTKTELPILLKDGSFSGNVDANIVQTIAIGADPRITFAKQPTSSDDPVLGVAYSTTLGKYLYNASATFNKAVAINNTDSENQELILFGQKFTVGSATDATNLILLKSAEKLNFDSSGTTSQEVTIEGKKYTVELVSASASAATVKVTNEAGVSEQKEINEGYSKKVNKITIAVNTADSNNLKYTASVVAGSEKVTLTDGSSVTYGDDDTVVDGTRVSLAGGLGALTKITISVAASSSDKDSILPGESFIDPVFKTFKVDFSGFNVETVSTGREDIKVRNSGDDKLELTMTDYRGNEKVMQYIYNASAMALQWDTSGHNIIISERTPVNYSDYVVLGNEDEGRLIKLTTLTNQSSGYSQDKVVFTDVFSGDSYTATLTSDGGGSITVGGKVYDVVYNFSSDLASEARTVYISYPDSSDVGHAIVYPTIQTSKGAKVMFYKPLTLNITNWDSTGTGFTANDLTGVKIPNGADTYQTVAIGTSATAGNFTVDSTDVSTGLGKVVNITNTGLSFNFTYNAANQTTIYLTDPDGNGNIVDPALVIIEEKDDKSVYEAVIVTTEAGSSSDDGVGVDSVLRTWNDDALWNAISLVSDSKKTKEADRWGTIALIDSADSDQKTATISYPGDQVYAQVYIAENAAEISPSTIGGGTGVTELGSVTKYDNEVSSVQGKNLIVVGGSCINTVAAKLLGSETKLCGAAFTTKTGVSADQFLVQVFDSPYTTGKVAMLVAGYEAADTTKAITYVTKEPNVATDKGTAIKKATATYADVATAASATAV